MKNLLLILIVSLFWVAAFAQPSPVVIHDWESFDKDLAREFETVGAEKYGSSDLVKSLAATHDSVLFSEMTVQRDFPLIALTGFLCVKKEFPKHALKTAMQLILDAKYPGVEFYQPVHQYLRQQTSRSQFDKVFSDVAESVGTDSLNFLLLVGSIPYECLYGWFHSHNDFMPSASGEATILDRLYGEAREHKKPITKKMSTALGRMQQFPGLPRAIFVIYTSSDESVVRTNLTTVLRDENISLPRLTAIVQNRRELVEKLVDEGVELPEATRQRIENIRKRKWSAERELANRSAVASEILIPKFTPVSDSWMPVTTQQEVQLACSLFVETNRIFDKKLYESVQSVIKPPSVISFHLISFIFSYPTATEYVPSFCETGRLCELICTSDGVSRSPGSTNEIPINYIRIEDGQKKVITAQLDLLLGVSPLNSPQDVRYFRRSFRFVYRDEWKEDK